MQQIERVGVVALLFLVVTIITVAMWDDGTSADTVQAAQAENKRTVRNEKPTRDMSRQGNPVSRGENSGVRSARARGEHETTSSRLTRQGEQLSLDRRGGSPSARDNRTPGGQIPASFDASGIIDMPSGSRMNQDPGAQDLGGMAFVPGEAEYAAETPGRQPRKNTQAPPEQTGAQWTYVVKKGDTLERIARHQLHDPRRWTEIQVLNGNLDPRRVRVGQKLTMPAQRRARGNQGTVKRPATTKPTDASYKKPQTPPAKASSGKYYVVQPGDVLGKISLETLGTSKRWREILDLNPKVDPRRLMVGTKLLLPKRGAGTPAPVGPQVAKGNVRTIPASVRKTGKTGKSGKGDFVVR